MGIKLIGGSASTYPARRWQSAPLHPFWFEYQNPTLLLRSLSTVDGSSYVYRDANVFDRQPGAAVVDYEIHVLEQVRSRSEVISYSSLTPSRATVNSAGLVTHVSDGSATIRISCTSRTLDQSLDMVTQSTPAPKRVFVSWLGASLAAAITARDVTLRSGKTPADRAQFTTLGSGGVGMVRNPNWILHGLNGYCSVAAWKSNSNYNIGVTAVTPRHVLTCAHSYTHRFTKIRFVGPTNIVYEREVIRTQAVGSGDCLALTLDADLPSEVGFAKTVALADINKLAWASSFETPPATGLYENERFSLPIWCLDQEKKSHAYDLQTIRGFFPGESPLRQSSGGVPRDAQRKEFYEALIGGDSGHPSFVVLGGDLVLVSTHYSGGGSGPYLPSHTDAINAAITAMDADAGITSGYQLTTVDLSAYPSY